MERENRDETRWLARILGIIAVLLGVRGIVFQFQREFSENTSFSPGLQLFIGLGGSLLLFWVGYRFFKCSSLWHIAPWLTKEFPLFNYFKSLYFNLNKHVRGGLVAGVSLVIMVAPLPLMFYYYKGVWFWDFIQRLFGIIIWPITSLLEMLNIWQLPSAKVIAFVLMEFYFFALGFVIGVSISYLIGRFIQKDDIQDLLSCRTNKFEQVD